MLAAAGTSQRRLGSSITLERSALTRARMRSRSSGGGEGPSTAAASDAAVAWNEASSARQSAQLAEMRLELRLLVRVERVQGVGGAQVVDRVLSHSSSSGAPSWSISRRRASPLNIRLLIVPSGSPSLSASSDCVNPP